MMQDGTPPTAKPAVLARFAAALLGRPVRRWAPEASLPADAAEGFALGPDLTLWRLPVGWVRIRERHRRLEPGIDWTPDDFRFPMMMADSRITEWLTCTAWLIAHPEATILVDTGEAPDFGEASYFEGAGAATRWIYPRIIDCQSAPDSSLPAMLARTGRTMEEVDLCVLTHLHSDHVGNVPRLAGRTRIVTSELETQYLARSGRLPFKLPQDGRVRLVKEEEGAPDRTFASACPLVTRGDIRLVPTPGHTIGHASVLIDLGDRRVLLAGDAGFSDADVAQGAIPGIVERLDATRDTYARLRAEHDRGTLILYTHDPANSAKLREAFEAV